MTVKILGIALIMFSSVLMGMYFAGRDAFHISVLNEFIKGLAILKSEIEFALTPLPEAMENISQRITGQAAEIFRETGRRLSLREDRVSEIWEDALRKNAQRTYLDSQDLDHLAAFGKTLGYLDRHMQLCSIKILEDYLTCRVTELTAIHAKNRKMFNSLGLLLGLIVVIVFL